MRYRIVRPEDLERITIACVEDAGSASAAVEQVPEATPLPGRLAVVPCDTVETVILVDANENPTIVQRGGAAAPVTPPPVVEEPPVEEPPVEEPPVEEPPVEEPPVEEPPVEEPVALTAPYDAYNVEELTAECSRRGCLPTEGSGSTGGVVKQDLIDALVSDDG